MNAPTDTQRQPIADARLMPCLFSTLVAAMLLAGCGTPVKVAPALPQSEGHLTAAREPAPVGDLPPPVRVSGLVPPPRPAEKVATYSVVVSDVPVRELLLALARDTRQNIDIHPGLTGRVTLNAINETLPAILERVGRQVDMRVRTEGTTIIVQPDTPFFRVYRVNYVNMQRDTTATIGASGQIGGPQGAPGGAASGTAGGAGASAPSRPGSSARSDSRRQKRSAARVPHRPPCSTRCSARQGSSSRSPTMCATASWSIRSPARSTCSPPSASTSWSSSTSTV